jgi:hypothetical protein
MLLDPLGALCAVADSAESSEISSLRSSWGAGFRARTLALSA